LRRRRDGAGGRGIGTRSGLPGGRFPPAAALVLAFAIALALRLALNFAFDTLGPPVAIATARVTIATLAFGRTLDGTLALPFVTFVTTPFVAPGIATAAPALLARFGRRGRARRYRISHEPVLNTA
jgi:hypothetical protein